MEILLGIFDSPTYNQLKHSALKLLRYPFRLPKDFGDSVIDVVSIALSRCNKCHFVLDWVEFPLNPDISVTCRELEFVLNHPYLLDKTQFWINGREITEEEALNIINKSTKPLHNGSPRN